MEKEYGIIFDFFGVLCSEIAPFWLERYFTPAQAAGIKADLVAKADLGTISEAELLQTLGDMTGQPGEQVLRDWLALGVADREVISMAQALGNRFRVALLSNAPGEFLHRLLRREALYGCFDQVLISSEAGLAKPDPAFFRLMLDCLALPPEKCVMIDDNPANLAGAARAGIEGLQFTTAAQFRRDIQALTRRKFGVDCL